MSLTPSRWTVTSSPPEHALISLLALNGLRVSEATGADIEHLGLERRPADRERGASPGRQHARHRESWHTKIIYPGPDQLTALFAESGQRLIEYQNFALEITLPCNLVFLAPGAAIAREQTPSGSVKDPQKDHVHTVYIRSPHGP